MKKVLITISFFLSAHTVFSQALPCPHFICEQDPNLTTYTVTNTFGSTYQWVVAGGNIALGQGTNSIEVDWSGTLPGNYQVEVTETDINGCIGTPVLCDITINPTPVTGAITHD
tara:strand:- start:344 stop:685 length:342 start_codon:yes stop_codon:yes gene_type:complete